MATDHVGSFVSACEAYLARQHALLAKLRSMGAVSSDAAVGLQARLDQVDAAMRYTQSVLRVGATDTVCQPDDVIRNDTNQGPQPSNSISNR